MNKKSIVLSGILAFSLTTSMSIMADSPTGELNNFQNKLTNILSDLHKTNVGANSELAHALQTEWDTMIQQHAGKKIRYGRELVPVNQDATYKELKQKVQKKLKTTINALTA